MHGFKSAIEPVNEIQICFWPKHFFWSIMKITFKKNITIMSQGPPNPGFRSVKVENWDFLLKDS